MTFTYGFYNSINGDRKYDAIQMSSIFDGIIRDGIFATIGNAMIVSAAEDMMVTVAPGRAWFDHTWSLNDAEYPIFIEQSEILQNRIDSIMLEVDSSTATRANRLIAVKGTPSVSPVPPEPIRQPTLNQYPLCNIFVGQGVTAIEQQDIENRVGTDDTPFITGILEVLDVSLLIAQWGAQWASKLSLWTVQWENMLAAWQQEWWDSKSDWQTEWAFYLGAWTTQWTTTLGGWTTQWTEWFDAVQAALEGNVAGNLLTQINNAQTELTDHISAALPHQFVDTVSGTIFQWGLKAEDGVAVLMIEEVA